VPLHYRRRLNQHHDVDGLRPNSAEPDPEQPVREEKPCAASPLHDARSMAQGYRLKPQRGYECETRGTRRWRKQKSAIFKAFYGFLSRHSDVSEVTLEIKYRRIRVLPPIGKRNRYPAMTLTVIHAEERGDPDGREKIDLKLITDFPVQSTRDVVEKPDWYAMRWKINVPQDTKVRLSGGGVETLNGGTPCQSDIGLLYHELASFLVDDDESRVSKWPCDACIDRS
jgi:hypothetical protein